MKWQITYEIISIINFRPRISADDWTLVINTTSTMDSGTYECSVNTMVELKVEDTKDMIMQDSPYSLYK